jgi:hypothetical protein
MTEPTPSLLQQITDALKVAPRPFTHPQYIQGSLYLTQAQWEALIDYAVDTPVQDSVVNEMNWDPHTRQAGINGYPVQVLKPGVPTTLPNGQIIIHSTITDSLYIYTPRPTDDQFNPHTYSFRRI